MIKNILQILFLGMSILMLHHFLDLSGKLSIFIFLAGSMLLHKYRKSSSVNIISPLMFVAMLIYLSTIEASNDLSWRDEVSVLPKIEISNDVVSIQNVRNVTWYNASRMSLNWETRSYDLKKLRSLDLIVEPFNNSELMAHTMLDFGFEDQGHLIISVEARKEIKEEYGLVAGALRQFELIYIFGDEKDLLGLRARGRGSKLHLYPIKADLDFMVSLFKDLANSANSLHEKPVFYRTLRDNCTTTLVQHIDRHYQQKIGLRLETIFPAKAGKLLYKLGRMKTDLSYPKAYDASRIDHLVRQYWAEKDFSSKLHAAVGAAYSRK